MSWLAWRVAFRALLREPGRALLTALAVALGVGVFLSIRLANRAAVASFAQFARGVGQGADLVLRSEAGPLPEADLGRLRPVLDRAWLRPLIEGSFTLGGDRPETFQLLGVDLVGLGEGAGEAGAAPALDPALRQELARSFYASLQNPRGVLVSQALALERQLRPGALLSGVVDEHPVALEVVGVVPEQPGQPGLPRHLLVLDLPAAQALLGRAGQLDRIEIGLRPGHALADLEPALRGLLEPARVLEPPEQRAESGRTMTAAFRFNLTVLSLIALAVGAYLLFQGFDTAVTRRRETWATLRALGLAPAGVLGLVLAEALVIGLVGSGLGVLAGWGLAQGAVRAVSRTVAALYGPSAADRAHLDGGEALAAFAAGLLTCLLAAWLPARRAALLPPVQLLARGGETRPMAWGRATLLGLGLLAAGLALAFLPTLPPGQAWHAYTGAVLTLLGGSLAAVGLLPLFGLLGRRGSWGVELACRPLQRPTGRHAWAAAALAVAVGMATGMGVMVHSFERTVQAWIGTTLKADLYLAPLGATGAGSQHRLSAETFAALAADPAVEATDAFQIIPIELRGQRTYLGAGDMAVHGRRGAMVMAQGGPEVLAALHAGGFARPAAVVSETFGRRFGVRVGDDLTLPSPGGPRTLKVLGVYADYGNERGSVIVDRPLFQGWWGERRFASVAVWLRPGQGAEAVAERWRRQWPGLQVRSNQGLREQVSVIFQQTFAITYALEIIGLGVAVAGLVQSLLSLALQRRGELLTLRALGAGETGMAGVLLGEGLGVAAAGLLAGVLLGLLLAQILVRVLNPQVFGWTLQYAVDLRFLAGLCALAFGGGLLALLPAARWAARLPADRAAEEGGA